MGCYYAAMTGVENLFSDQGYHTPDQRAACAKWMLGEKYNFQPFYYAKCILGRENEVSLVRLSATPSVLTIDMTIGLGSL